MTDQVDDADKARKERSPSFPFISLKKACERIKEMAEAHKKSQARLPIVGSTWGYAAKSSGLLQTVAALKAFGLIEDIGAGSDRKIQITDLGWRILHDERPGARDTAIKEAALKPRLIAEYVPQWVPDRPSDAHCMSELQLDRGFNEAAANTFLRVFDITVQYANLKNDDSLSPSFPQEINMDPAPEQASSGFTSDMTKIMWPKQPSPDPFKVSFGQGRITGTFDITCREDADDMISMINAVKSFLKTKEAAH